MRPTRVQACAPLLPFLLSSHFEVLPLMTVWRRPPASMPLVWHRFADDDWAVFDPGPARTHAMGMLSAALLTELELGPQPTQSLLDILRQTAGDRAESGNRCEGLLAQVESSLQELRSCGLIESA